MKVINAGKYHLERVDVLGEVFYEAYKSIGYDGEIIHEFIGEIDIDLVEDCRLENGEFDYNALENICVSLNN